MLLARRPEKLKPDEKQLLAKLNECCPEGPPALRSDTGLRHSVPRTKQSETLKTWIDQARASGLPEMGRFCDGLHHDDKAINAAVVLPWSQRPGRRPNSSAKTGEAADVQPG